MVKLELSFAGQTLMRVVHYTIEEIIGGAEILVNDMCKRSDEKFTQEILKLAYSDSELESHLTNLIKIKRL